MWAAKAQPRMLATTSVSRAATRSGALMFPTADPLQLIGIQCWPTHFRDRVGRFHDAVSYRPQLAQIDFGVSPHASC